VKRKYIPKIGEIFERLTIESYELIHINKRTGSVYFVFCNCACGNKIKVLYRNIRTSQTKSCGCLRIESGKRIGSKPRNKMPYRTMLYQRWREMNNRCNKPSTLRSRTYKNIIVCKEWKDSFQNFYEWAIQNNFNKNLTIDRIDNNGNYEPSNCRLVDTYIQANNKNNNKLITAFGDTKTVAEWTRDIRCKIKNYHTLYYRIIKKSNLTNEEILTVIPKRGNNNLKDLL
jgi:hypothetical protein